VEGEGCELLLEVDMQRLASGSLGVGVEQALSVDEPVFPEIEADDLIESAAATYEDADPDAVAGELATQASRLAEIADAAGHGLWWRGLTIGSAQRRAEPAGTCAARLVHICRTSSVGLLGSGNEASGKVRRLRRRRRVDPSGAGLTPRLAPEQESTDEP